jgi:hypothetical protein
MRLLSATVLLVCVSRGVAAQAAPQTDDLLRIAEAYRLAGVVQTSVWPGWDTTPFPVLLVSGDREFLIASHNVPAGFSPTGNSTLLQADIWSRPRQFDPGLLATFPAFGPPPVVVIGRAEVTGKRSVAWVLTLLHEHFHQYQMSEPGYYAEVEQLGLSGGDQTGMWMLNYPFPYESPKVARAFASVSRELGRLLVRSSRPERRRFWRTYTGFLDLLSDRDRRYLSFQVWQEGVARYVELRIAELAAQTYKPSLEFRQLRDAEPFAKAADSMRASILRELAAPDLAKQKRVGFYAFGAGLALLLDQDGSAWKSHYLKEKFALRGG